MSDQQRHICGMVADVGKHFDIQHWVFHYRVSVVYIYLIKMKIIFNSTKYQFGINDLNYQEKMWDRIVASLMKSNDRMVYTLGNNKPAPNNSHMLR